MRLWQYGQGTGRRVKGGTHMTEQQWDKKLKINTTGRSDAHADEYHHPYEPTPYCVLERLAESGYITKDNIVIDYGCGKGRVGFFLHHEVGCRVIGVEYDEKIYLQAQDNLKTYHGVGKNPPEFICADAAGFEVKGADCFYFFNPFSLEILQSVLGKILESYYEEPRDIQLLFYYPADDYIAYLMAQKQLMFVDEIECMDLFEGANQRERILIFEIV